IDDLQKQYAGELAQYLLDLIPRETAAQYRLPDPQIDYKDPMSSLDSLKPPPRPVEPVDSTQKAPPVISRDPGKTIPPDGPPIGKRVTEIIVTSKAGAPAGSKPDVPARTSGGFSPYPMTANLRPTILYREKAK